MVFVSPTSSDLFSRRSRPAFQRSLERSLFQVEVEVIMDSIWDVPVVARLAEAAKFLRLSERTVWQMGRDGKIGTIRQGRAVLYYVRDYLQAMRSEHAQCRQ